MNPYNDPTSPQKSHSENENSPMIIPGRSEEVAEEIAAVSVEGRPGDPKSGPGLLRAEVGAIVVVVLVVAGLIGWWFGPMMGVMVLAIGAAGVLFNPVVGATLLRANEREEVVENQRPHGRAGQHHHT